MKNVHKSCGQSSVWSFQMRKKVSVQMQMQVIPSHSVRWCWFLYKSLSFPWLINSHYCNRHSLRFSGRLRPHHASFHKVHKIRLRMSFWISSLVNVMWNEIIWSFFVGWQKLLREEEKCRTEWRKKWLNAIENEWEKNVKMQISSTVV